MMEGAGQFLEFRHRNDVSQNGKLEAEPLISIAKPPTMNDNDGFA
jgi:hypothetical protein